MKHFWMLLVNWLRHLHSPLALDRLMQRVQQAGFDSGVYWATQNPHKLAEIKAQLQRTAENRRRAAQAEQQRTAAKQKAK